MRLFLVTVLALACVGEPALAPAVPDASSSSAPQAQVPVDERDLPKAERRGPSEDQIAAAREYLAQRRGTPTTTPAPTPTAGAAEAAVDDEGKDKRLMDAEMAAKAEADCKAGKDGWSCFLAAATYDPSTTPRVRPADPVRAVELARKGCDLGEAGACAMAGSMLAHGSIGTIEERRGGIDLLQRACDLGHGTACLMAATILGTDRLGPADMGKAVALAEKACEAGHGEGCFLVAAALDGDREQIDRRVSRYEKGCELGSDNACSHLSILLHNGEGIPADVERARKVSEGACARKLPASCLLHGTFLMEGIGGPKDREGARASLTIACEDGSLRACGMLKE